MLYIWANSCYDSQAGLRPDAITMPAAQLWEKPGTGFPLTPTWLLGNFMKRWKIP